MLRLRYNVIHNLHPLCHSAIVTMLRNTNVPPHGTQARNLAEQYPSSAFITHLVYLKGCAVTVDVKEIHVRYLTLISSVISVSPGSTAVNTEQGDDSDVICRQ